MRNVYVACVAYRVYCMLDLQLTSLRTLSQEHQNREPEKKYVAFLPQHALAALSKISWVACRSPSRRSTLPAV